MYINKTVFTALLVSLIFLAGCNRKPAGDTRKAIANSDSLAITETVSGKGYILPVPMASVKLVCKEFQKDSMEIPYYKVYLSIGGKETFIREVNNCSEIPKEEYARYEIPKEAFEARGGWYAGGGDYFYLIMRNGQPVLFEGWQEEGQEDTGYHWKEKKIN